MGTAVGRQIVIATGVETTWNTPVTVNRFYEVLAGESLERKQEQIQSNAMIGGGGASRHARRGSRRVTTTREGVGSIPFEVATVGFGRQFNQLMGGTPTIAQQGGTTAYLHTYAMGDLVGKSQTIQKQLRDSSDAEVESFTFSGAKVMGGEFSIDVGGILTYTPEFNAADVVTNVAAAAVSLTTPKLFHYKQTAITVAGVAATLVNSCSIKFTNPSKTDRYHLGSAGVKKEQVANDFAVIEGTINAEFDAPATFYDRYVADTPVALVLEFVGDLIASTYYETFRITIPEVRFGGDTPKASSPDLIMQDVPFAGYWDGSAADATITYMTTDTAS